MKRYNAITVACLLFLGLADPPRQREQRQKIDGAWQGRGAQWEMMTKQVVNFRDDATISTWENAGRHNGRFSHLMIRAEGAPVEIRRMVINFDNGEKFEAINQRTRLDQIPAGL